MRQRRYAAVLIIASLASAHAAAAQTRALLIAAVPMGATALTVWASNTGAVLVRPARARQAEVALSTAGATAWIDSSTAIVNARPAREPHEEIRFRYIGESMVLERVLDDTGDRLWLATTGDDPQQFPITATQIRQLDRALAAAREATERMSGGPHAARQEAAASAPADASSGEAPITDQPYFEFQVEKQVTPLPGNEPPRYPEMLRSARVEGEVLAQFVVDTTGAAEIRTFKVLKSSHDLFTQAVKQALATMRFSPAEVGGRKVRQLVQMPFEFSLNHD